MAQKVYLKRGGLVLNREDDTGQRLEDLPVGLEGAVDSDLRWNGTAVVNASTETDFYINGEGDKCLLNDAVGVAKSIDVTVDINRRAVQNDDFVRATGSFLDDGFAVGDIISVHGTVSCDGRYKILTVSALEIETDEDFTRPPVDELGVTCTIESGYQLLEGISFTDVLNLRDSGLWVVKSDERKHEEAIDQFKIDLKDAIDQHISTHGGTYPDRRREQAEYIAAELQAINGSPTYNADPAELMARGFADARDIYDKKSASATAVSVTFDATLFKLTRATGDWSADGFQANMTVTITGSVSNNRNFRIKGISTDKLSMNLSARDEGVIVQEGPVTVDVTGLCTIDAWSIVEGNDNPGDYAVAVAEEFMQGAVINYWLGKAMRDNRIDNERNVINSDIWTASTAYVVDDYIFDPGASKFYVCNTGHTSDASSFLNDIANWDEYTVDSVVFAEYPTEQLAG